MSKSTPNRSDADRHAALETAARAHVARWIDHPEVKKRVRQLAEWAAVLLAPIEHLIPTAPAAVIAFIAEGLAIQVEPEHLSPPITLNRRFNTIDAKGDDRERIQDWALSQAELVAVKRRADKLGETASRLARVLEKDGVKVDVSSPGDLFVLGQLLVYQHFDRPEFAGMSGRDLARYVVSVFSAGAIGDDARSVHFSDHVTATEERDLVTLRARLRATRDGVNTYRAPYAEGAGKRRSPKAVVARRNALWKVLQKHPNTDPMTLHRGWRSRFPTNAGRMLRDELGMGPNDPAPSPDVLRRDLRLLRDEAANSG